MDDRLADRLTELRGQFPASSDPQAPDADTILGGISDGIVALDNEWRLVYANAAATRIWGRDLNMFMGKSITTRSGFRRTTSFGSPTWRRSIMASRLRSRVI